VRSPKASRRIFWQISEGILVKRVLDEVADGEGWVAVRESGDGDGVGRAKGVALVSLERRVEKGAGIFEVGRYELECSLWGSSCF